jgi:outer membrane protein assembly factor BamD (BamD/ComL family)
MPSLARPTRAINAERPAAAPVVAVAATPAAASSAPVETHASLQLGDQVESVDRARAALAAGDPALARRLVDDYDARFGSGILSQEAAVIRIEALAKSGDAAAASALAASFLQAHPTSPHAARIRRLTQSP